jgi:hypothetical protein
MVVARRAAVYEAFRKWVHESPLNLCTAGSDTCDNHELVDALTDLVMDAGTDLEPIVQMRAIEMSQRHAEILKERERYQQPRRRRWWVAQ